MKLKITLLLGFLFLCLPPPLYADEPIKVGVYQNEPLVFVDDSGPQGIFVNILNYIGKEEAWQIEYIPCMWDECLTKLENGEIDLLPSIAYSNKRSEIYDFNQQTVLTNWGQLYIPHNSTIQSFLDLQNSTIAVLENDIHYHKFAELLTQFEIPVNFIETDSYDEVLALVEQEKVRAGLVNRIYGVQHENEYNIDKSAIMFNPIEVRFAASKGQNEQLLQTIDVHLTALKHNPESIYHQTINKWLTGLDRTETLPDWLLWVLSGAGLLIAVFFVGNMTLRKQVHSRTAELAVSESRYRNLIKNAPIGIVAFDRTGNINTVNPALLSVLGSPSAESTMQFNMFTFPPLVKAGWSRLIEQCMESGQTVSAEMPYTSAWNKTTWLRAHFTPTVNDHNIIMGGQGLVEDITPLREALTALEKEREELRTVLQSISDYVWSADVVDGEMKYRYYSPVVEQITGYPPNFFMQGVKQGWLSIIHPQDVARVENNAKKYLAGQLVNHEYRIIRADGNVKWLHGATSPTLDEEGRVIRLDGVVSDITERKQLEEQLHQAQKMEAIGTLAGGIAHDFNNMLTAVMGYTGLTLQMLPPDSSVRPDIESIERIAHRGANLVRQLLAYARRQIIEPKVINLNELLLNTAQMLKRLISEDIELVTLTSAAHDKVNIDPGQIEQVLFNLVVNARDAMPTGGKIIIKTQDSHLKEEYARQNSVITPGHYVMLTVADTGTGMTETVKNRLFEPFFTTKEVGKGSGLGLATCIGIIRQNKGHITVQSRLGEGTTFEIYLPLAEKGVTEPVTGSDVECLPRGTETILLVEDEEMVRELAWRTLEQQGYKILQAGNGKDALQVSQKYIDDPIHLLLTDIVMPQMGGLELADIMKNRRPQTKILFITGYSDKISIRSIGNFLQKPFSPTTLACKVREILDGANKE